MTSYSIFQDWKANRGNIKGRIVMFSYRMAHLATSGPIVKILLTPYLVLYKVFIMWILGVEIQHRAKIGPGLKMFHGQALVIHKSTVIGKNCTIRQSITIGNKISANNSKTTGVIIGDNVEIGANTCIIGQISIGDNVVIGAGSVVVKNVPANTVIAGNPARIIRHLS
ncbi:putative colanic acid biosynthesis acetyltransferase WcaB [Dyadobacter koreensis]|uniref:Serine acetyltransferase n=1 Tax=Dyadobacter koreensis TaxID=408657 RepID=A0A1H6Q8W4_9BACT|nr:DapH/DapD/GlmU-related protein [Dyadobacter koreensis]SEI40229.1 putative colanic acid biosynthesis acetyltransferase WcaB [Dyadobacter koreensis]